MGRGKATPHRKQLREDGLPELQVDYRFMSTQDKFLATILVAKETTSKMVLATMVPMKGASIEFPVKRCLGFLKEIGLGSCPTKIKCHFAWRKLALKISVVGTCPHCKM